MNENDLKTLTDDPEARKAVDEVFIQMHRALFKLAHKEGLWGPVNETLSQVRKKFEPHFERISEAKRKK